MPLAVGMNMYTIVNQYNAAGCLLIMVTQEGGSQAGKQAGRRAGRQAGGQASRRAGGQAGGQAGRQAGGQSGGQAGRRTGRQAGRPGGQFSCDLSTLQATCSCARHLICLAHAHINDQREDVGFFFADLAVQILCPL